MRKGNERMEKKNGTKTVKKRIRKEMWLLYYV